MLIARPPAKQYFVSFFSLRESSEPGGSMFLIFRFIYSQHDFVLFEHCVFFFFGDVIGRCDIVCLFCHLRIDGSNEWQSKIKNIG